MARRVPAPTPEEIELRAKEIRVNWSERETEKRRAYKTKVVYAPAPEAYFTEHAIQQPTFNPRRRLMSLD